MIMKLLLYVLIALIIFVIYVFYRMAKPDGAMVINSTDPDKDYFRFIMYKSPDDIKNMGYMIVKVKIDKLPIEDNKE